jgi:hypothetical protein
VIIVVVDLVDGVVQPVLIEIGRACERAVAVVPNSPHSLKLFATTTAPIRIVPSAIFPAAGRTTVFHAKSCPL